MIEKTKDTLRLGKQKGEIRIGKEGGRDRDLENRRERLGIGKTGGKDWALGKQSLKKRWV